MKKACQAHKCACIFEPGRLRQNSPATAGLFCGFSGLAHFRFLQQNAGASRYSAVMACGFSTNALTHLSKAAG
jgi:hypothetical protein